MCGNLRAVRQRVDCQGGQKIDEVAGEIGGQGIGLTVGMVGIHASPWMVGQTAVNQIGSVDTQRIVITRPTTAKGAPCSKRMV
jgi:hypothetical protein